MHERHIQWQKQKMKVKITAQTLSASVADALEFCEKSLGLAEFHNCSATVEFIRTIDPLSRGYKSPMRCENESNWRPFLLHAIDYLKGLKLQNGQFVSESVRKTGVIGFLASALSVMHMFDCLVKQSSHPSYKSYKSYILKIVLYCPIF